nr:GNAT family N-acetyltransferase [Nocardia terpenica]
MHHHIHGGGVEIAMTDGGEGIVGVALWDPPGRWDTSTTEFLFSASQLTAAFAHRLPAALRTRRLFDRWHPREPHWYLCNLAVLPRYQRQGIGGALLRSGCSRCDRDQQAAYLVCTRDENIGLYEAAGFATVTPFDVDGTPLWPMWRDPHAIGR